MFKVISRSEWKKISLQIKDLQQQNSNLSSQLEKIKDGKEIKTVGQLIKENLIRIDWLNTAIKQHESINRGTNDAFAAHQLLQLKEELKLREQSAENLLSNFKKNDYVKQPK